MSDYRNSIITGDALAVLGTLPDACVQMVCTSPPYFGLRDYGTETILQLESDPACSHIWIHEGRNEDGVKVAQCQACNAVKYDRQIGLEDTPARYISRLVEVFREVKRVLRDDGTCWLNIGDSYAGSWGNYMPGGFKGVQRSRTEEGERWERKAYQDTSFLPPGANPSRFGLKPKDLMMMPARLALALQEDGWWLRSDIIWAKSNAMPESVTDRPTSAHEHIFLLAKSERYFYDAQAVAEPYSETSHGGNISRGGQKQIELGRNVRSSTLGPTALQSGRSTRNKRNVWTLASQPYLEAHFACVDEETECLTSEGWKRYSDLKIGMTAAQFEMSTSCLSWAPIEAIATYPVIEQPMIAAKSRDVELLLTPNHRTIIARRHPHTREWQPLDIIRADELKPSHAIPVSAEWDFQGETPVSPDWAELLGWYLAEGCETVHSWTVEIYQSKSANPQKVERIRYLLNAVGAEYTEATASRSWREQPVSIAAFQIRGFAATYLRQWAPGKQFPDGILCWSDALLTRLLDGLIDGDGHRREDGRMSFIQRSKTSADLVQAIGVRLGYSTQISWRSEGTYTVYFTRKRLISFRGTAGEGAEITSREYTGIVWCPKLPAGTWVARKSGRTFITGNTFPPKLIEPCILAGSSPRACEQCGAPWERVTAREPMIIRNGPKSGGYGSRTTDGLSGTMVAPARVTSTGWQPTCRCPHNTGSGKCIVLDPFLGAGTTALVALQHHRDYLGIELNPEYVTLAKKRIATIQPVLWEVTA